MAWLTVILIGVLAKHLINCAPSENEKIKNIHKSEHHEPKISDESYSVFESDDVTNKKESQRHKRWYDNFPYNYPPPYVRPYDTGSELENNLSYIKLRLQEILNMAKSPPPLPPPSFYPVYVSIYIPQPQCGCNPTNNAESNTKAPVPTPSTTASNETVPDLHDRLPEMEDERQNWGILVNNTLSDYDDDDDGSRPISLTPIFTGDDGGRPAPPVDHGSKQDDINNVETQRITTASPLIFERPLAPVERPNACDSAVMSCCFGPDPTYKCVQSRGCRDRSISQNPCNPKFVLSVLSRIQSYYS